MFGHKWQAGEGTVRKTRVSRCGPFHGPIVGEVVKLKCDPARKEARFDLSEKCEQLARDEAALPAQIEREEADDRARFPSP